MRKATPSLHALKAFESAARHQSFARAAEELAVTPSAVSQQVSQLEATLGVRLFKRVKQRLKLTNAGSDYQRSLASALDRIEFATMDLVSARGLQHLRVGALPSLASYWLIPRLPAFVKQHPTIRIDVVTLDLDFSSPERSPNLGGGRIDVGLFYGDGHWNGLKAEKLMDERLIAVAAPEALKADSKPKTRNGNRIDELPLLQHSTRPQGWAEWFRSQNQKARSPDGPSFEHFHMLVEAAKAGLGVALVPDAFVISEMKNGTLVQLGKHAIVANRAYFLITDPVKAIQTSHGKFCDWLRDELIP